MWFGSGAIGSCGICLEGFGRRGGAWCRIGRGDSLLWRRTGGFVSGWVLMDSGLSTYFGQLETGVGVLDYGRHAVAVDGEEDGLF